MSIRNLDKLFAPRRVAVIGAGGSASSVGRLVLANLLRGFEGVVYPVNPRREAVHGVQAYPSVGATPEPPDLAVVCTPTESVPGVIAECAAAGVPAAIVITAGFREVGERGIELERAVAAAAAAEGEGEGVRILGPNCLGVIVPRIGLNASFAAAAPPDGELAFVTQSGALATSVIDWAIAEGVGFSHVVSAGNMLDVDLGDLIDHIAGDPRSRALVLYLENVTDARKFISAARAFSREKPIIAYKAGRSAASAAAAVSHTGAIAGEDAVYDAAFERAGIVRVDRLEEIFTTSELLARTRPPRGPRLAIVTNAGGPGVMATDALIARGGELADLGAETRAALEGLLPAAASAANPVDVLGDAGAERYRGAVSAVIADRGVDALLVILTPQAMTDPTAAAEAVVAARGDSRVPLLAAWLGGPAVRAGAAALAGAGIATYDYPEQAVDAFMRLVSQARRLETLNETPRALPPTFAGPEEQARARAGAGALLAESPGRILGEAESKRLLDAYGIAVTEPLAAADAEQAVEAASRLGYPVVLKLSSPDITHKTDVGGVATQISTPEEVRAAFERIVAAAAELRPGARVDGVTVQAMAAGPGHELLLGARQDPTFGAVVAIGAGGIAAELMDDRTLGLPPLNERLARRMLEPLRIWPLLQGYRGRPGADLDALLETMIRFSQLVADHGALTEIEINPLLATPRGAIALDARAVVADAPPPDERRRFSHLAIAPYPDELTRTVAVDGLEITLRPIRPEDEPLWREMLDACSLRSIRMRFRAVVKYAHEMATRYCFIDYDREIAIVAELEEGGRRTLAGVGRLVADPDRRRAEYAILVADPWQGRGLAHALTERCLEIASEWGVEEVFAETTAENLRMTAVLERHGFRISRSGDGLVVGERAVSDPDQAH